MRNATPRPARTAAELVAEIEGRIASGELRPGDRLEPVRVVAAEIGLAPNTVAAAYRALGERGVVIAEGRRGTFVATRPPIAHSIEGEVPEGIVDLSDGNPDPALLPDLGPVLATLSTEHVLYGSPAVDPTLRDLLAADLDADGIEPAQLTVVGGALDGIERTLAAHLRPGDRVGIEDPGYSSVLELAAAMALRPEPIAVDRFGPTPDAVGQALRRGVAAIVVTPRAGNPSGAALDADRAAELRRLLAEWPEVLIVEDDHAGRVAGVPYESVVPPGAPRWAMVRSMAKSLGPDLRLAALAGDAATVGRVSGRQSLGTGWVPHLLQRVVAGLLADEDLPSLLDRAADAYAERRAAVVDELVAAGLDVHGRSGLNVWVPVDDEASVVVAMQRRGFAIRSGARYRTRSRPGVRISTAGSDPSTLRAAAEALVSVIGSGAPARSG